MKFINKNYDYGGADFGTSNNSNPDGKKQEFENIISQMSELENRYNAYLKSLSDIELQKLIDALTAAQKNKNWFERLPLHWRYLIYMGTGIILGIIITL